jgi:hypothetical protein
MERLTPVCGITIGEILYTQVRVDEHGLPVLLPATFMEYVDCMLSMSCLNHNQWDAMKMFIVKGGQQ